HPLPVPRPLRRDRSEPEARGRQADGRAPEAAEQKRRDRDLSGGGPRLPRRLPAVVQRGRGAGCLEALHRLLREEPASLAPRLYAAGVTTSVRAGPSELGHALAPAPRSHPPPTHTASP